MRTEALERERERLWQQLGAPAPLPATPAAPVWYLALMLGAAAWFAGVLLLIVTAVIWSPDRQGDFVLLALLWGLPGLWLLRLDGLFVGQLGLALLIAGESAAVVALGIALKEPEPILFASTLLFAGSAALAARPAGRVLNVLAACAAWVLWLRWSLLGEPWDRWDADARPLLLPTLATWLVCWGPMLAVLVSLARHEARWMATRHAPLLRATIVGIAVALAFATPLADPLAGLYTRDSDGSRDWMALWPLLSLLAAAVAAAVAFQQRMRGLLAVCLGGMLLHLAHVYYALGISLIAKSVVMLLMGAGLLGLAVMLREERT